MGKGLLQYAFEKSKFLSLEDGEEVQAKFLSFEITPNHFGNGEAEIVQYHLEIGGVKKILESGSGNLAKQMAAISPGDTIAIKRVGVGNDTKYVIAKIEG